MEPQKHDIRRSAQLQHMGADVAGTLIPAAAAHCLQVRSFGAHPHVGAQAVRRVEQCLQIRRDLLQTQEQVHQNSPVAILPQGPANAGAGDQGYLPLGGDPTGQHNNFHGILISFRSSMDHCPY